MKLGPVPRERIYGAFREAFADYGVDMSTMTEEHFMIRADKNAVDWDLSVGATRGDRLVGFTLIGVGEWGGVPGAFDAATGIVPEHRGRGLARVMFDYALPFLRERGVRRFVLEVIQGNEPAVHAYRKAGFEVSRELGCFDLVPDPGREATKVDDRFDIRESDRSVVGTLEAEADWLPSWENSFAAIRRIRDNLVVLATFEEDEPSGAIVFSPALGWIMSLIVARTHRRLGIGSALVRRLAAMVGPHLTRDAIKLLNVDRGDEGMIVFAERCGFVHRLDQFEMIREI